MAEPNPLIEIVPDKKIPKAIFIVSAQTGKRRKVPHHTRLPEDIHHHPRTTSKRPLKQSSTSPRKS